MNKQNKKPTSSDDLLSALKKAEDAAQRKTQDKDPDNSKETLYDQANQERGYFAQRIQDFKNSSYGNYSKAKKLYDTAEVFWNKYLKPISIWANPFGKKMWNANKKAFNWMTHDSKGGFNKHRVAPVMMLLAAFNYVAVTQVVPFTVSLTADFAAIELLSYEGTSVFSKPNWVNAEDNILQVFSCDKYPCQGEIDSMEFRMSDSPWLDLKYAFTRFSSHDPGQLAGAFLSEENVCTYEAYGHRIKFPFIPVKYGFYPHITAATCQPVNGDNSAELLQQMQNMQQMETVELTLPSLTNQL